MMTQIQHAQLEPTSSCDWGSVYAPALVTAINKAARKGDSFVMASTGTAITVRGELGRATIPATAPAFEETAYSHKIRDVIQFLGDDWLRLVLCQDGPWDAVAVIPDSKRRWVIKLHRDGDPSKIRTPEVEAGETIGSVTVQRKALVTAMTGLAKTNHTSTHFGLCDGRLILSQTAGAIIETPYSGEPILVCVQQCISEMVRWVQSRDSETITLSIQRDGKHIIGYIVLSDGEGQHSTYASISDASHVRDVLTGWLSNPVYEGETRPLALALGAPGPTEFTLNGALIHRATVIMEPGSGHDASAGAATIMLAPKGVAKFRAAVKRIKGTAGVWYTGDSLRIAGQTADGVTVWAVAEVEA